MVYSSHHPAQCSVIAFVSANELIIWPLKVHLSIGLNLANTSRLHLINAADAS